MPLLLDCAYLLALLVLSPWLAYKALTTGKYRRGLWAKLTGAATLRPGSRRCAWFHGVSVGEIHLLRQVIDAFRRRHPDWVCVVSATTDTGLDEARKHFADLTVFPWPLDFSWAVRRALRRVRPSLVVLAESELWPNFLLATGNAGVPVAVINARMSPRSFRRFARLGGLSRWLFGKVTLFAAQTDEYADHLRRLGARTVEVTGSVKYDGVSAERDNAKTRDLGRLLGVESGDLVWVAGSTQAPEEEIVLESYRRLRREFPRLRLIVVPRQKDRFEEVAGLLRRAGEPFARRSQLGITEHGIPCNSVTLIDTIGELSALWGLADVAFVGGSLDGRRGGQNMIEPAAYGAAVTFGPHVWNFRATVEQLLACDGAVQVPDEAALESTLLALLADAGRRLQLGEAARRFVLSQQGAAERTLAALQPLIERVDRLASRAA